MRLLLDTQIFIWWDGEPGRLEPTTLAALQDPANTLVLSVVSIWEMQIKVQLGKLTLKRPLKDIVESQQKTNNVEVMPVKAEHVYSLHELPPLHKDPFGRLLIAQAKEEGIVLVSVDPVFSSYSIHLL